jgi:DHA2 family lincomycin resistance protein-like MFS transporter
MKQNRSLPLLVVLYCSAFIAAFNENIVNTGLIDIMDEFSVSSATAQWLVTGYMIVTAIIVTVVGFLLKRFSLKSIFTCGALIMVTGSLGCMFAPSFALLLAFRMFTSIGTGIFIPSMMNTILIVAPRKRLGTYMSIGGCMITFGPAFAPVVSGLMVTMLGWRSIFLVPTVLMAILLVCGLIFIHPVAESESIHLDLFSVILSAVGLSLFVFGIGEVTTNLLRACVLITCGLAIIAWFVARQNRVDNPLMDLRPMSIKGFSTACILVIVAMMTTFSMSVLLPLYFESAAGTSAFVAGALILIPILVNAATSLIGGRIMDSHGEWPLLSFGFLLIVAGLAFVAVVGRSAGIVLVVVGSVIVYAGVGLIFSPSQTAGLKHLDAELNPYGVAIMSTFIQVAACIGPSLFVGVLSSTTASQLSAGVSSSLANAAGFSAAVLVAACIGACGLLVSFFYARGVRAHAAVPQASRAFSEEPVPTQIMMRDVYKVREDATVEDAVRLLLEHQTGGVPIVDERDHVVGFISDGDIMKAVGKLSPAASDLVSCLAVYRDDATFESRLDETMHANVMELATTRVVSVEESTSIEDICTLFGNQRIKKVPVVSNGTLVGSLNRSDVTRYLMRSFLEHEGRLTETGAPSVAEAG